MTKTALLSTLLATALAVMLSALPAQAQRVFVAAQGSDVNPCTFALPCRTFQHAHDTVATGGEIDVLDPAGYGSVTITKPISIQGHGFSGISVPANTTGVTVDAAGAVNLNGLLIDGGGAGLNGIRVTSVRSLTVANCVVRNMAGSGLRFVSGTAGVQTLAVSESHFTDNALNGILIETVSSGPVAVGIERVALYGNQVGLSVLGSNGTGTIDATVTDSVAGNSAVGVGFNVQSAAGHSDTSLFLTRITASGSLAGIQSVGANATIRLTGSTITGNGTGYAAANGGVILSYGDNAIDRNGGNTGTLGNASKQ
jgi:hypothetical protein